MEYEYVLEYSTGNEKSHSSFVVTKYCGQRVGLSLGLLARLYVAGLSTRTFYKKLSYRLGTARCVVSVEILPIATQQCRNYLYDKS